VLQLQRTKWEASLKSEVDIHRVYRAQGSVEALDAAILKLEAIMRDMQEGE
jgi:hypothetical protein